MRIRLENISYRINNESILEDVSLDLEGPGLIQLLGPNGAGKTTLLRIITGLLQPTNGRVYACEKDITGNPKLAGQCMGYVPQRPPISKYNPMTVADFLSTRYLFGKRWPRIAISSQVAKHFEEVTRVLGITRELFGRRLWELSGGQLMRVFIARTLLHDPKILLLDEPLAPVDPRGKSEIAVLLGELAKERLVIVTSHDPMLLMKYTKTIILLNRRIYAVGKPDEILDRTILSKVYGQALVEVEKHIHIVDEHGGMRR